MQRVKAKKNPKTQTRGALPQGALKKPNQTKNTPTRKHLFRMPPRAIGTSPEVNFTLPSVWDLRIPSLPLQHVCLPGNSCLKVTE